MSGIEGAHTKAEPRQANQPGTQFKRCLMRMSAIAGLPPELTLYL